MTFLLEGNKPFIHRIRSRDYKELYYGFGDVSGTGFGASFQKNNEVELEYKKWNTEEAETLQIGKSYAT